MGRLVQTKVPEILTRAIPLRKGVLGVRTQVRRVQKSVALRRITPQVAFSTRQVV